MTTTLERPAAKKPAGSKNGNNRRALEYFKQYTGTAVTVEELAKHMDVTEERARAYANYIVTNHMDGHLGHLRIVIKANLWKWVNERLSDEVLEQGRRKKHARPVEVPDTAETVTVPNITVVAAVPAPVAPQPSEGKVGLCLEVFRVSKTGTLIAEGTDGEIYRVEPLGVEA